MYTGILFCINSNYSVQCPNNCCTDFKHEKQGFKHIALYYVFSDMFEDWEKSYNQTQNEKLLFINDCQAEPQCDIEKRVEVENEGKS